MHTNLPIPTFGEGKKELVGDKRLPNYKRYSNMADKVYPMPKYDSIKEKFLNMMQLLQCKNDILELHSASALQVLITS